MASEMNQPVILTQGERLRLFRDRAGLTRKQLAEMMGNDGVGDKQLGRYEREESEIPTDVLRELCLALDISADFILGLRDIPSRV